MLNRVTLIGRMTKDPELRYSQNGTAVCSFTIAVNRFGKKDEADFISVTCFKGTAENVANYQKKGSLVGIDGRIQTRNYEKDGHRVYVTDVVADTVAFLERVSRPEGESSFKQENRSNGQNRASDDPFKDMGTEVNDDDLPF